MMIADSVSATLACALFILACAYLALAPRTYSSSRTLLLLRALFPSWRFFETVGSMHILEYRIRDTSPESDWTALPLTLKRRFWHVIFNPRGNMLLAVQSLLEQVNHDLQEVDLSEPNAFQDSVSYRLVDNVVRFSLREMNISGVEYQFRLRVGELGLHEDLDTVLQSLTHRL